MKKLLPLLLLSLFLIIKENSFSQTAISTGDGNWTNPVVWSCNCVPTSGYTIIINHNITLDADYPHSSGSITINGSLIDDITGRQLWVYGTGVLTNNGTLEVKDLLYEGTGGPYMNHGTTTAIAMMTTTAANNSGTINAGGFLNTGTFTDSIGSSFNADSITNSGTFYNDATATMIVDSVTNAGTFYNNGIATFNQFTNNDAFINNDLLNFTDLTNNGSFTNTDSLMGANSFWNTGTFDNASGSYFQINNGFLNNDPLLNDAVFTIQGVLNVLDSWYNMDTVKGTTGSITVADTSFNSGRMLGTFDFCDLTPPPSPPFIDLNLGFISPNINWCSTGVNEISDESFIYIFPNPVQYELNINATASLKNAELTIYNQFGQIVKDISNINNRQISIDCKELSSGLYFVLLKNRNKQTTGKFIVDK